MFAKNDFFFVSFMVDRDIYFKFYLNFSECACDFMTHICSDYYQYY